MPRLASLTDDELSANLIRQLEPTRVSGQIADVYRQFANSEEALSAYLIMEESLRAGSLADRDIESIKLLVSQLTRCDYCLSTHTMKARKAGLDTQTRKAIREGRETDDKRLNAITSIVRSFFRTPGPLEDGQIAKARTAGLTDANLVDLAMVVSTIFFTNITNHINDTKSTLPPAPAVSPVSE
ncbi:hypothetical protein AB833_06395 [Chromatiales bacterium (ex Bugula neritina AB1)]|nr:hypothetical protein AB833_06395 [Chromatiales bacterium (ex Bugula neritina AB1)]